MLRILFYFLFIMSSVAFAQAQEKKEAYKFFEYDKISDSLLEGELRSFCAEIRKVGWTGYIINYGKRKQVAKREKQILDNLPSACRGDNDPPRITLLAAAGDNVASKTELWIVPPGERPPTL